MLFTHYTCTHCFHLSSSFLSCCNVLSLYYSVSIHLYILQLSLNFSTLPPPSPSFLLSTFHLDTYLPPFTSLPHYRRYLCISLISPPWILSPCFSIPYLAYSIRHLVYIHDFLFSSQHMAPLTRSSITYLPLLTNIP